MLGPNPTKRKKEKEKERNPPPPRALVSLLSSLFCSPLRRMDWMASFSSSTTATSIGGWATVVALTLVLIFHSATKLKTALFFYLFSSSCQAQKPPHLRPPLSNGHSSSSSSSSSATATGAGIPEIEIVSEADLRFLIQILDDDDLDEHQNQNQRNGGSCWETVTHRTRPLLSYTCKSKRNLDGPRPLTYLSLTVFDNCSPDTLRDFYMDNHYRMLWDNTFLQHHQLQVHATCGIEFGRTIKKFPLLTPRDYVLAWRMWHDPNHHTFYCFIKDCQHPMAPPQRNYVRVGFFRSGWRIKKVPGRNACEIKMFHQEDSGLNAQMAKLAFARGIWSYVCKMDNALRKYSAITHSQTTNAVTALSLIQKVPPDLEIMNNIMEDSPAITATNELVCAENQGKKFPKRPSRRVLANGLLLLGGIICLSRGHSSLGAKVAMAYILTKLRKRDASSSQSEER